MLNRSVSVGASLLMLVGALAIPACGDDAVSDADGGVVRDAATRDAAVAEDADTAEDSGALDAGASGDAGQLDATVPDAAVPVNGGDTCELARDVTAGGTLGGQSTRAPATDTDEPMGAGCPSGGAASGRDVTYVVQPTVATSYRVRVVPTTPSYDPMLYAVRTCGATGCVAGTVLNGPGEPEEIMFSVAADESVFIIVDGELASSGEFELTVTIEP